MDDSVHDCMKLGEGGEAECGRVYVSGDDGSTQGLYGNAHGHFRECAACRRHLCSRPAGQVSNTQS